MTNEAHKQATWRTRTVEIRVWKILAVLLLIPFLTMWFMVVHQKDEIIALGRNEVTTDAAGQRTWHGTFFNTDDIPYREVAVTVRFLDSTGQNVGQAEAETDLLPPQTGLDVQASLPQEAVNLRIHSVQWRNDHDAALLGPFREPWEFGYLQTRPAR